MGFIQGNRQSTMKDKTSLIIIAEKTFLIMMIITN